MEVWLISNEKLYNIILCKLKNFAVYDVEAKI